MVKICEVVDGCEDCPKYGDDCDGETDRMSDYISRADAIERIVNDNVVGGMDRINEYRNSTEHNDYLDGISCAIATVDDVPSAETHEIRTETHGVCLISKDDAMGAVQDHFNDDGFKGYDDGQKMMDRINALPSADAEQGEWIEKGGEIVCSVCGNSVSFSRTPKGWVLGKFCQSCGTRMKGGAE